MAEKVWLVHVFVDFEPGHHVGIYSTRETAILAGNAAAIGLSCKAYQEIAAVLIWSGQGCEIIASLEEVG